MTARSHTEAPHAPKVGRVARFLGRFHVTGVFWYRFPNWGVTVLPRWGRTIFVALFTTFFFFALIRIRRAIASNLVAVLGPCGWFERQRRIFRTFHTFAWCLSERYEHFSAGEEIRFTNQDDRYWKEAIDSGEGFAVVTGHLGNWEIGSGHASWQEKRQVHVVREEELDPRAQEFMKELLAERMGDHYTTHFAKNDPRLSFVLLEALGRGEIVALQGDRPRAGGRTVTVELFGRPYELPQGPFALARAAGARLVPAYVLREARFEYVVQCHEPIWVARTPDREADFRDAAQKLVRTIETTVREKPHQWFCFRKLWDE